MTGSGVKKKPTSFSLSLSLLSWSFKAAGIFSSLVYIRRGAEFSPCHNPYLGWYLTSLSSFAAWERLLASLLQRFEAE